MFKEVGKTCPSGFFPVGSHVVLDGDGDYWVRAIGMQDLIQPVFKGVFLKIDGKLVFSSVDIQETSNNSIIPDK